MTIGPAHSTNKSSVATSVDPTGTSKREACTHPSTTIDLAWTTKGRSRLPTCPGTMLTNIGRQPTANAPVQSLPVIMLFLSSLVPCQSDEPDTKRTIPHLASVSLRFGRRRWLAPRPVWARVRAARIAAVAPATTSTTGPADGRAAGTGATDPIRWRSYRNGGRRAADAAHSVAAISAAATGSPDIERPAFARIAPVTTVSANRCPARGAVHGLGVPIGCAVCVELGRRTRGAASARCVAAPTPLAAATPTCRSFAPLEGWAAIPAPPASATNVRRGSPIAAVGPHKRVELGRNAQRLRAHNVKVWLAGRVPGGRRATDAAVAAAAAARM